MCEDSIKWCTMVVSTDHTTDRMDVCPQFEPESGGQGTCAGRGGGAAAAVVPPGVVGFGVCEMAFVHESDRESWGGRERRGGWGGRG